MATSRFPRDSRSKLLWAYAFFTAEIVNFNLEVVNRNLLSFSFSFLEDRLKQINLVRHHDLLGPEQTRQQEEEQE